MIRQVELSYETGSIQMTTSIFESMVHNLGEKIRRMKVKIQFRNEKEKNDYLMSEQRHKQREEQEDLASMYESEESKEEQENGQEKEMRKLSEEKKMRENAERREIPVSFEMSILLREKYFDILQNIGRRLNVRFMVVPNKVKIAGWKIQLVNEAEQQFSAIQDKIHFDLVANYGCELYQSKIFKRLLKEKQLQLIKVLSKYYIWYEDPCPNPAEFLEFALVTTKHAMIPLHKELYVRRREDVENVDMVHGKAWHKSKTGLIVDLLQRVKATIFQQYIDNEINRLEKREHRKIELSEDRKNLILHLDAEQQLDIQDKAIEDMFQPFQYVFLLFEKEIDMSAVSAFLSSYVTAGREGFKKNKSSKKIFFYQVRLNFACLSFLQNTQQSEEVNIESSEIMKFFRQMPPELVNFRLVVQSLLDGADDDPQFKKFSFEKDFVQKATYVSLKNPSPKNFELMLQLYIERKFDKEYKYRKEELNNAKAEISQTIDIDMSRPVDESSLMFNESFNNSMIRPAEDKSFERRVLPPELVNNNQPVFRFQNYSFCLEETAEDRQVRYSDKVEVVKKKSISYSNADYEKAINGAMKSKFKIYRLIVPVRYKSINLEGQVEKVLNAQPELAHFNRWVSVFYGGKEPKDYDSLYSEDQSLKVLRFGDNSVIKEGYMLRTNVVLMFVEFQEKSTVQLSFGRYQALYFLRRLE